MSLEQAKRHNRYLIVSDLHLTEVEDNPDGWMRYKHPRYRPDEVFAELLADFVEEAPPDASLTAILNGDILDFELVTSVPEEPPWPVTSTERRSGLCSSEAKSIWKLRRMIDHHPRFVEALASFIGGGHRVVYVLGNHDRQFHYDSVKEVLLEAIRQHLPDPRPATLIQFEPWFYRVPGEIYAEHGNQYDPFSSYRYVLSPLIQSEPGQYRIAQSMGNLSCRHLINRMGFFNPHAEDFILNLFAYLAHWWKHYAFTGRGLIRNWIRGSHLTLFQTLKIRRLVDKRGPVPHREAKRAFSEQTGLSEDVVKQIDELKSPPVADSLFLVMRELWIDRALIALLMTGATVALALTPTPVWLRFVVPMLAFPLIYLIYEALFEGSTFAYKDEMPRRARRISELTGCPVIAFGHSHEPMVVPLSQGRSMVNSGAWAPTWERDDFTRIEAGKRNYIVVDFNENGSALVLDSCASTLEDLPLRGGD